MVALVTESAGRYYRFDYDADGDAPATMREGTSVLQVCHQRALLRAIRASSFVPGRLYGLPPHRWCGKPVFTPFHRPRRRGIRATSTSVQAYPGLPT